MKNKEKAKTPSPAAKKIENFFKTMPEQPGRARIFFGAAVCVLIALIIFVLLRFTYVEKIEIDANMSFYNESRIIEACGIGEGDSIIKLSSARIKKNLKNNLPMISKVSVSKSIFGKIKIKIEYKDYQYFYKYNGGYAAVDCTLIVKDTRNSMREYISLGAVYITLPETEKPEINRKVTFKATTLETDEDGEYPDGYKNEEYFNYITAFLTRLAGSEYFEESNAVFVDEKFNIILIYGNKYKIIFGNSGNTEQKLSLIDGIIAGEQLLYAKGAVIDLTNPAKPSARVDNSLDFSEYVLDEDTETENETQSEIESTTDTTTD